MNTFRSLSCWISQNLSRIKQRVPPEFVQLWPFWVLLSLSLMVLYYEAVASLPDLRQPSRLAFFTILFLAHLIIYWIVPRAISHFRRLMLLLAVQAGLIFTLTYISRWVGLIYGLYIGLVGLCAGTVKRRWVTVGWVAAIYLLAGINYSLIYGRGSLWNLVWMLLPLTIFVVGYVWMFLIQIESRQRAQTLLAELETAHRQLAEYAGRVEELTLTTERQRMARELHDTLAQGLAGLTLQLEAADVHLTHQHPERAQAIIQQAMERARATMMDARRAIDDLRAAPASGDNLAEAIQQEAGRFTQTTHLPCDIHLAMPDELPAGLRQNLARMVAEGLTNITRHAHASRASIHLSYDDLYLELVIQDDGAGFDPLAAEGQPGHYGLLGIRERARLAGGVLEITSAPQQGTILRVRLPRKMEKQDE